MVSEYSLLLSTLEWKQKREIILKRDNYKCTNCKISDNLHVHHTIYYYGRKPWDYKDKELITLCKDCHEKVHSKRDIKSFYYKEPKVKQEILAGTFIFLKKYGTWEKDSTISRRFLHRLYSSVKVEKLLKNKTIKQL